MRVVLNSPGQQFRNDLVRHYAQEGARYLTERDALNLSSVNKEAWLWRQRVSSEDDPSK